MTGKEDQDKMVVAMPLVTCNHCGKEFAIQADHCDDVWCPYCRLRVEV